VLKTLNEHLLYIVIGGIIGLLILLGITAVFAFLSIAVYAASVDHSMSVVDYLYNSNYNHTVLKFILFVTGGLGIILLVVTVIASFILLLRRKQWLGFAILGIITVSTLFLFFVPVSQTQKVYAVKGTLKNDIFIDGGNELTTPGYKSVEQAKQKFFDEVWFSSPQDVTFKTIVSTKKVYQPLLKIEFPQKPASYDADNE
jgi:glucan phosphoethanolaminetransferase (alkaline phosphatase superfamily)